MRRTACIALLVLALTPAVAFAAAATMSAPSTAKLASRISIRAAGLKPGRYTLELAFEALPGGASPTNCVGKVGVADAHNGQVTINGTLPSRLDCYQGVGAASGHVTTQPGRYDLTLGVSFAPNGFSSSGSFVMRKIRLTK